MATQFEIDCALMSGAAYFSTRSEGNRFSVPQGWEQVSYSPPVSSGFEASAFGNGTTIANSTEIVISFAGTYLSATDLRDLLADIALAKGDGSAQLTQAVEYYLQVKAANPNATITLTGHSLGGGLAALVGVFFGVKAVTFDQAQFANSAEAGVFDPAFILKSELLIKGYSEAQLSGLTNFIEQRTENGGIPNSNLVSNIRVDGEFLTGLPVGILFDTIGSTASGNVLTHGQTDLSGTQLHSIALLTAFVQNPAFRKVTDQLTDLLEMILTNSGSGLAIQQ